MKHHFATTIRCLLLAATIPIYLCTPGRPGTSAHTIWDKLPSSTELQFHPCYDGFECTRLILPLDWQIPVLDCEHDQVVLAIIKLPATVPQTHPNYRGTVIINPGGPGASGVRLLESSGKEFRKIIDGDVLDDQLNKGHFDVISFDPRGVLFSSPNALCFSDPIARKAWQTAVATEGLLDQGESVRRSLWARAKALGAFCENNGNTTNSDIRRYMSTASVARDMLAIIDLLKQQRPESRAPTGPLGHSHQTPLTDVSVLGSRPSINYWGFSYGTILGMTFASLFPDRIDSMVLDGVMDADDYIANGWSTNLEDAEAVMHEFYEQCSKAGPSCALFDPAGPDVIEQDLKQFLENLRTEPLYDFELTESEIPDFVTYGDVKKLIFPSLYHPPSGFPRMADSIWQLKHGKSSVLFDIEGDQRPMQCSTCGPETETVTDLYDGFFTEVGAAILCGDGEDMSHQTLKEFETYVERLTTQSPTMGALWARIRLSCTGWKVRPNWRFTGPFTRNTSSPLLFVSTTRDPVTPLSNARRMSKRFPGSVVLEQENSGHTSSSAMSNCTRAAIGRYFQSGTLPAPGTKCAVDELPFGDGLEIMEYGHSRRRKPLLPFPPF